MADTVRPNGIPSIFKPCDKYLNDEQIRQELGLNGTEHADHYGHHIMCTHFVVESKSKGKISKAIRQLENTVPVLANKGFKIDRVVIFCDRMNKNDSRIYEVKRDSRKKTNYKMCLYDKNLEKFVEIPANGKRYFIEVMYK